LRCFTATSTVAASSSGEAAILRVPLYTHPKPPSPTSCERLRLRVALLSSEKVKTLRFAGLSEKLGYCCERCIDSALMSETLMEPVWSEPDGTVDDVAVLMDRAE
jgi:hypothetical protein